MKSLRNWAAVIALTIFVAGAVALEAQPTGWLSHFTNASSGAVQFRAMSSYGRPVMVGHGTAVPSAANDGAAPMDGEVFVVHADSTDPDIQVYNANSSAWETIASIDTTTAQTFAGAITFTGAQTFTGAGTFNGNATLGSDSDDDVTVNAALQHNVRREDFESAATFCIQDDATVCSVVDGEVDLFLMPGSQLGMMTFRPEAPDGPGVAGTYDIFSAVDVLSLDTLADDVANEGGVLVFGAAGPVDAFDTMSGSYYETGGPAMYCEVQVDIVDISDTDDLWFGWVVSEAFDNPPASASYNTSALFNITDGAGDIDIITQLNGGGELADDAGTDWTDGDQFVLRVNVAADAVTFEAALTDASTTLSAITQTNAVLNMDDGDKAFCLFGWTLAAASDPGITIEYVEIGEGT